MNERTKSPAAGYVYVFKRRVRHVFVKFVVIGAGSVVTTAPVDKLLVYSILPELYLSSKMATGGGNRQYEVECMEKPLVGAVVPIPKFPPLVTTSGWVVPCTCNRALGFVVPIPIVPSEAKVIRSSPFVTTPMVSVAG